ncbi:MAG: hypothetical protein A2Z34_05350 [Planctomycetes bacterium RBG_16_59_8]|nr:MAG: hypothetical protein A2Z34_05350 [Planctomycetes bacterium RBG_16_59_8]
MTTGLDARVEPLGNVLDRAKESLGLLGSFREKRRWKKIVEKINERIRAMTGGSAILRDDRRGEPVCHLKIARPEMFEALKAFAGTKGSFRQLAGIREEGSWYLPVDFAEPFGVEGAGDGETLPVGSAVRLRDELVALNKFLRVEESFALKNMVDFMDAGEAEIAKFEKRLNADGDFWLKFGFVTLKKLADRSVEHRYPIVFD